MRNLRTLEQEGMVNSTNDYQDIINAIAKVGCYIHIHMPQEVAWQGKLHSSMSINCLAEGSSVIFRAKSTVIIFVGGCNHNISSFVTRKGLGLYRAFKKQP